MFTETFRQKYGVQCAAALHHNKAMTNYHIHLVFADRETLAGRPEHVFWMRRDDMCE